MKWTFKKQLWISIAITMGSLIAAGIGLYFLSSDINAHVTTILAYRSEISSQNSNLSLAASLKEDAPKAVAYTTAINKLLLSEDELINFPQMVDTEAKSYNLTDTVSFAGDPVPGNGTTPGYAGFTLDATGQASQLQAFLKEIETQSSQFIIQVNAFSFVNNDPQSRLTVQGQVFFQ